MDAAGLAARLADFCHGDIALQRPGELDLTPWQAPAASIPPLSARELQRRIADDWRVTSYSGLQQHGFSSGQDLLPRLDIDAVGVGEVVEEPQLTPHQFPRGAAPGTFLHSLFEELDFTQPVPDGWMAEKLQLSGFDAQWAPVLTDWLGGVLKTRLPGPDIALNQLAARDKQVEMAFYLPIAQLLTAERLDALIRQYDPLSADTPPLDFRQVRGMLKGFIDLSSATKAAITCWITNPTGWGKIARPIPGQRWSRRCGPTATICSISCTAWRCTAICAIGWPITTMTATSAA